MPLLQVYNQLTKGLHLLYAILKSIAAGRRHKEKRHKQLLWQGEKACCLPYRARVAIGLFEAFTFALSHVLGTQYLLRLPNVPNSGSVVNLTSPEQD